MFGLTNKQVLNIDAYIDEIKQYNKHTNIVGKSTLANPWTRHVLDSLQVSNFINNKKGSIIDLGTGAGIPGIILCLKNYPNITLIDSNNKKIKFIKLVISKLKIKPQILLKRIEDIDSIKYDFIISRALANLNKLFFYSKNLIKKNTTLIFLKGRGVDCEINNAKLNWNFDYVKHKSISDSEARIIVVRHLKNKNGK